jgi:hypothetical protein
MMKQVVFLAGIIICITGCSGTPASVPLNVKHFETGFSLYQDTIPVEIHGDITHAVKHQNKLYLLSERRVYQYGGYGKRWLHIIANGEIMRTVDLPADVKAASLDFYVKDDTLILRTPAHLPCYYFDHVNYQWGKTDLRDDLIFEDDQYYVYSLDFGQLGGATWFEDKRTGLQYIVEASTPLVNKIDANYYLTTPFRVLKIEDPSLLHPCHDTIRYEFIRESRNKYFMRGVSGKGFEVLFEDTTVFYFDIFNEPHIVSSFEVDDELLHIYQTDTAIHIARIKDNSIEPVQKIAGKLTFFDDYVSYRRKNMHGQNELLKFCTEDEQLTGIMEIVGNEIHMLYFANSVELSPKIVGESKADEIFAKRLQLVLSKLGMLTIEEMDATELRWGSFDITPNHKIGIAESYYPNPNNFPLDTATSYLLREDSLISNSVIYYASSNTQLIRVLTNNWKVKPPFLRHQNELITEKLERKMSYIENAIIRAVGDYHEMLHRDTHTAKIWKTMDGFTIRLESWPRDKSIRLIIYKH